MDNTFVFSDAAGYDMVVAVTQQTINDQISTLASPDVGIIKTELIVEMAADPKQGNKYVPMVIDDWSKVPKDVNGTPVNVCMRANYMPSISITDSGTTAALVLSFSGGEFFMRDLGSGNILPGIDMTGWVFGIVIDLDFADIERQPNAPKFVVDQLNHFSSDMFRVSQLFLNFERSELTRFEPSITKVGNGDDDVKFNFTYLMTAWLKYYKDNAATNPFILGYTITRTDKTKDSDSTVPDSLRPIGNTFNVYKDPDPNKSTLNFILNTDRAGHQNKAGQHASPGNFNTNWILPTENIRAKMIYSSGAFLEDLILEPFYQAYAGTFQKQLSGLAPDNSYQNARSYDKNVPRTFSYLLQHSDDGSDNQYWNSYTVSWKPLPGSNGVTLAWNGTWHVRERRNTNVGLGTASAWGQVEGDWNATMTIECALDDQKRPILSASKPIVTTSPLRTDSWRNDWAKVMDVFGDILGEIINVITAFSAGDFVSFFQNAFGGSGPTIGVIDISQTNVVDSVNSAFLLPGGDVFSFKNFSMLDTGESCLELTYKAETGGSTVTPTGPKPAHLNSNVHPAAPIAHLKAAAPTPAIPPPSTAAPLVDKLALQQKTTSGSGQNSPIDATISCELMQNFVPAMPVSPSANFSIVQDDKANAHLLSISSDGQLNLLVASSGQTTSGWTLTNLNASFTAYSKCLAFDIYQDQSGRVSLAFALQQKTGTSSDVFMATNVPSQQLTTLFGNLQSQAQVIKGIDPQFIPEKIRFGPTDDGKMPMLAIEGTQGTDHVWYQINSGSTTVTTMAFPENVDAGASGILEQRSGFMLGQRANTFLYKSSGVVRLSTQAVDADGSAGNTYDYSAGNTDLPANYQNLNYNTIDMLTSRPDPTSPASDIFIGAATGVYRIPNGKHNLMEAVTETVKDVHAVTTISHGNDISVWALTAGDQMWYIHGQRQQATPVSPVISWQTPVLFASNVVSIAGIRSVYNNSNEVFVCNQDFSITHYWQDPSSTMWQSRTAGVPNSQTVSNFESYTTHLHLESGGVPLVKTPLRVTCSQWQYYTINGLLYSLDMDVPAQVTTDSLGNLTMIAAAQDIATQVIHVESDLFAETLNIYPCGKIQFHLKSITDGQSLRNAVQQDGKPVIDPATTTNVSDGVAANIASLHGAAADNFPPARAGNVFTVAESPTSSTPSGSKALKHTQLENIKVLLIPKNTAIGGTVTNGVISPLSSEATVALLHAAKAAKFSFDLGDALGDIWHHIEQVGGKIVGGIEDGLVQLDTGISFVLNHVDDVLSFVLKISDKVITIALKSLLLVFKALNYVFKLFGIDLTVLMRWLGHFFGWDEIWDTHKAIAGYMRNGVDFVVSHGQQYIDMAKASIDALFDGLDEQMRAVLIPDSTAKNTLAANQTAAPSQQVTDMNSPQMNFVGYHLNQGQQQATSGNSGNSKDSGGNTPSLSLSAIYEQLLKPMAKTFVDKMGATGEDLLQLITHGSTEDLKRVLFDVIDTMMGLIKQLVNSLLDLTKDSLGTIKDLLDSDLDVPIMGPIYDFVTTLFGEEESFSVVNGVSFIIAIPVCVVMKIADLGSFAASEAAKRISTAEGIADLVAQATFTKDSTSKAAVHVAKSPSGGRSKERALLAAATAAAATDPTALDAESAAALGLMSSTIVTLNNVLIAEMAFGGPTPWRMLLASFQLFGSFASAPIWPHKLGKPYAVCFLRWLRWVILTGGTVVACVNAVSNGDIELTTTANMAGSSFGTIIMFVIDVLDPPPAPYFNEGWASDVLLNGGTVGRNIGLFLKEQGGAKAELVAGIAGSASCAVAGAAMGMHMAIENWMNKEDAGGASFAAATRNWP